ncbi:hypothetical protein E0H22_15640 [Rhodopseudomonas boonkerdii]|uniref:hypothetical protein n=1 Tax=Rhodopseudomonas boonkerdii TaxID=475937 RepID=UPI001E4B83FD|nr:hypothetical protein [Rhodopseudomonas boonkerdii]UGV26995.1 hypothetical protein E0H22_15640 [Rhodopseudomonas boonkerdii]
MNTIVHPDPAAFYTALEWAEYITTDASSDITAISSAYGSSDHEREIIQDELMNYAGWMSGKFSFNRSVVIDLLLRVAQHACADAGAGRLH